MSKLIEGIDYKIEGKVLFISEGVEEIPDEAFKNNRKFLTLVCPSTLKYIGKYAFNGCIIENLKLNVGLEYIDVGAFSENSFQKLIMPDTIYYVGNSAFSNNPNLEQLKLSNSLGVIQMHTFSNCISLKTLIIPESVKVIEKYAFLKCDLSGVIIPNSVIYTDICSFYENKNFNSAYKQYDNVVADTSFEGIIYGNFKKVMRKKDYYIDHSNRLFINEDVEIIPPFAFKDMEIRDIVFPPKLRKISRNAFENCKIYSVTFPNSLIYIAYQAFVNCKNLKNIKFNEGLKAIEEEAFSKHQATEIDLPESLVYLGRNAFDINSYYSEYADKGFVNINPKNIKFVDFTGNSLSNVDVMSYPPDAYIAYSEYSNRKRKINDYVIFDEKSSSNIIGTLVDNNKKKIDTVCEQDALTIGKIIKLQVDNYLLNKDKYASMESLVNVIESLILSGGNINITDDKGNSLLVYLYNNNLMELVQLLLKYGADINSCDANGVNMLMHSINKGDANMFSTLLKLECDINSRDVDGNTPLVYAIKKENIEFIKSLIDNNAYINITNRANQSILDFAKDTNQTEIINLFVPREDSVKGDTISDDLEQIKLIFLK